MISLFKAQPIEIDHRLSHRSPAFRSRQELPTVITVTATDPDNDTVTFSLVTKPVGMTIDATTGVVSWTPTSAAVENVVVEARDARGAIATQGFAISVRDNRPPRDQLKSENNRGGWQYVSLRHQRRRSRR